MGIIIWQLKKILTNQKKDFELKKKVLWHLKMCCGTKKCAVAPKNVLWHQKMCCDTKKCAAAPKNVLRHKKICYGTKQFATAIEILLLQKIRFAMKNERFAFFKEIRHL